VNHEKRTECLKHKAPRSTECRETSVGRKTCLLSCIDFVLHKHIPGTLRRSNILVRCGKYGQRRSTSVEQWASRLYRRVEPLNHASFAYRFGLGLCSDLMCKLSTHQRQHMAADTKTLLFPVIDPVMAVSRIYFPPSRLAVQGSVESCVYYRSVAL